MPEWLSDNRVLFYWVTGVSAAAFVASLIIVPFVMVRLPADYFSKSKRERRKAHKWQQRHPAMSVAIRIGKNLLGWGLILAGLAMLVLPGQGLLAILLGIMLADVPGKDRLIRWIISRGKILRTINRLRAKFGREPLEMEGGKTAGAH